MTKKLTLLALVAACAAMFALPSVASAGNWKLDGAAGQNFTITGPEERFTAERLAPNPAEPLTVHCSSTVGSGEYTTETTGTVFLLHHGCKATLGGLSFNCTSSGHPTGTITVHGHIENVHIKKDRTTPGVTITGTGGSTSATISSYTCFGITTTVHGSIIGHLNSECDASARTTFQLEFASGATEGEPKWRYVTEDTTRAPDDLDVTTGGTTRRGSFDAATTMHFPSPTQVTCGEA